VGAGGGGPGSTPEKKRDSALLPPQVSAGFPEQGILQLLAGKSVEVETSQLPQSATNKFVSGKVHALESNSVVQHSWN
jgi:hypothetical protein